MSSSDVVRMKILSNGNVLMTSAELQKLPNYSCTIPTGATEGKQWRRAADYFKQEISDPWWRGEIGKPYPADHEHFGSAPIHWKRIEVCDGWRIFLKEKQHVAQS